MDAGLAELAAVADTLDVWAGPTLYRVFLLRNSLQVDLSFWPAGSLNSTGGQAFELIFGDERGTSSSGAPDLHGVAGWGWLYALHGRSAIAPDRPWQSVQMLDGLRGQIVILCCSRLKLDTHHGRGVDQLPPSILAALASTLPATVSSSDLAAAYTASVRLLITEIERLDPVLASRLENPLTILQATAVRTSL